MNKVFIAIDGSNFYYKLKELGFSHLSGFNYEKFISWLAKKKKVASSCFYIGRIREEPSNKKSKQLKRGQDKLLARLKNMGLTVKDGYILKSDGSYHEKGVDVQIAVDICMKAVRDEYDQLILVSSDTDLIPAIDWVKKRFSSKKIEYVGFSIPNETEPRKSIQPTLALIKKSDMQRILIESDLKKFVI